MDDNKPLLFPEENTNEEKTTTTTTVDQSLLQSGPFGRYQLLVLILCNLVFSNGFSFQSLITYYAADDPPWVCVQNNVSLFCHKGPFQEGGDLFIKRCSLHRSQWKYTLPKTYSFTTEFDLVCSKEYLKALSTALFFVGCIFGALLSGPMADKFGRKPIITGAFFVEFLSSLSGFFVSQIWHYLLLRSFVGLAFGTLAPTVFVYFSENMPPKTRNWASNLYFFGFTISMLWISLISYFVPYWRKLVLYTSAFPLLAFLLSWLTMESPYWLYSNKKYDKAEKVLQRIAKINGKNISVLLKKEKENKVKKQYSYFHLFNCLKVFLLTILQSYLWLGIGLVYYAIALESSNLGGSLYTNFILSSLADVPGYCITVVTSMYFGRKKVVGSSFLMTGSVLIVIGFIPMHYTTARVALAILGRLFSAVVFNTIFLWTFEIYPTVVRSQGMNICQMFSRLGSTAAPFLTSVLSDIDPKLPFFIMSGLAVLGAVSTVFLPETIRQPTREVYEDLFETNNQKISAPPSLEAEDSEINNQS